MPSTIQDVMTPAPMTLPATASLRVVAEVMRDSQIGSVLVVDGADRLVGIVTDRDLVVRGIAAGFDPDTITVAEIASPAPVTVGPNDDPKDVVELMRENGIRRVPVANGGDAVGIVTLGDLALDQDAHSVLAEISALPSNN
jgi:CBS domain-containing protein